MSVRTGKRIPEYKIPNCNPMLEAMDYISKASSRGPASYIVVGSRTLREIELSKKKIQKK